MSVTYHVEYYNPVGKWILFASASDRDAAEGLYHDACLDHPRRGVRLIAVLETRQPEPAIHGG